MEGSITSLSQIAATSRLCVQRMLIIGEDRLELLAVEVQEERDRLLHAFLLALIAAGFCLLAGIALSAAIAVALWAYSPAIVLLVLAGVHGLAGFCVYRLLVRRLRDWQSFSASIDQLKKDRACLDRVLA